MSKLVKSALLASIILLASSLVLADRPNREGKRPGQDGAGIKPCYLENGDGSKEDIRGKSEEKRKKNKK